MQDTMRIENVIYDAAQRRFCGQVRIGGAAKRAFQVSAPGHPQWEHRRITSALVQKANAAFKSSKARLTHLSHPAIAR